MKNKMIMSMFVIVIGFSFVRAMDWQANTNGVKSDDSSSGKSVGLGADEPAATATTATFSQSERSKKRKRIQWDAPSPKKSEPFKAMQQKHREKLRMGMAASRQKSLSILYGAYHLSALHGCARVLDRLLTSGALDINKPDGNGYTALHLAAARGRDSIVTLLLEKYKMDSSIKNEKTNETALDLATKARHQEVMRTLHELGSDSNIVTPSVSSQSSEEELFKQHIAKMRATSAKELNKLVKGIYLLSVAKGCLPVVEYMLKKEKNLINSIDENGFWSVHHAAFRGNIPMLRLLIDAHGANVNALTYNVHRYVPLHLVASNKNLSIDQAREVIGYLVRRGADVNAVDSAGKVPFYYAQRRSSDPIILQLLAPMADFDSQEPPLKRARIQKIETSSDGAQPMNTE